MKAVSRVESAGWIARLNERFDDDAAFRADVERAHAEAAVERERLLPGSRDQGGVGGTRRGVKCLHAHYANHLAGGDDAVGAWVADRVEPIHASDASSERIAVVDQGTHSCRLLVVERRADDALQELAADMVITRARTGRRRHGGPGRRGAGDGRRRSWHDTAAARGRSARDRIRVAATSAVRDASNRDAFVAMVRRHADTDPEVIAGEEEARLSFLGGTRGLPTEDGPFLLVDIGGGSTEFVVGREPGRADRATSTQMGSVRLTERHLHRDPPAADEIEAVRQAASSVLSEAESAVPEIHTARTFVSVAGTATTIQAIALGLDRYDPDAIHRSWLRLADAERTLADLAAMTNVERAAIPVMAPGRGDVIVAGAVILTAAMRRFGFDRTLVSETDILWGLALDTLGVR